MNNFTQIQGSPIYLYVWSLKAQNKDFSERNKIPSAFLHCQILLTLYLVTKTHFDLLVLCPPLGNHCLSKIDMCDPTACSKSLTDVTWQLATGTDSQTFFSAGLLGSHVLNGDNHPCPKSGHAVSKITAVWHLTLTCKPFKIKLDPDSLYHEIAVFLISMNYRNQDFKLLRAPILASSRSQTVHVCMAHWREKPRSLPHRRPGIYRGIARWMFSFWKQDLDKENHKNCWLYPFVMCLLVTASGDQRTSKSLDSYAFKRYPDTQ